MKNKREENFISVNGRRVFGKGVSTSSKIYSRVTERFP